MFLKVYHRSIPSFVWHRLIPPFVWQFSTKWIVLELLAEMNDMETLGFWRIYTMSLKPKKTEAWDALVLFDLMVAEDGLQTTLYSNIWWNPIFMEQSAFLRKIRYFITFQSKTRIAAATFFCLENCGKLRFIFCKIDNLFYLINFTDAKIYFISQNGQYIAQKIT